MKASTPFSLDETVKSLQRSQYGLSRRELISKIPLYFSSKDKYSVSDDEEEMQNERINFRLANLVGIVPPEQSHQNIHSLSINRTLPQICSNQDISGSTPTEHPETLTQKPRLLSCNSNCAIDLNQEMRSSNGNMTITMQSNQTSKSNIQSSASCESQHTPTDLKQLIGSFLRRPAHSICASSSADCDQKSKKRFLRSQSFEERTGNFEYLTNLHSLMTKATHFKREADFEMLSIIFEAKSILFNVSSKVSLASPLVTNSSSDSFILVHPTRTKDSNSRVLTYSYFLISSTIELKNGECKRLLDCLVDCERVFKKINENATLLTQNKCASLHKLSSLESPNLKSPKLSVIASEQLTKQAVTGITNKTSPNTFPKNNFTQPKSRFFPQENNQAKQTNSSPHSSDSDESSIKSGTLTLLERRQLQVTPLLSRNNSNPNGNINSPVYILPNEIKSQIKRIFAQTRYIFTKVGTLIHYFKMQTYFYREDDIVKIHQSKNLRLFQPLKPLNYQGLSHIDSHVLIDEVPSDGISSSPQSCFSLLGGMSPQISSPFSSNKSGSKEDLFNIRVLYQKVNENIDVSDQAYKNLIDMLRKIRQLEQDSQNLLSKQSKYLFYQLKERILDGEMSLLSKREFLLARYLDWKAKRWLTIHKRQMMENKKLNFLQHSSKQVCRICDRNVLLKDFKDHSKFCKELEEVSKEIKANMSTIHQEMFYFLQKSRSFGVKCQLLQKSIDKIEKIQILSPACGGNQFPKSPLLNIVPIGILSKRQSEEKGIVGTQSLRRKSICVPYTQLKQFKIEAENINPAHSSDNESRVVNSNKLISLVPLSTTQMDHSLDSDDEQSPTNTCKPQYFPSTPHINVLGNSSQQLPRVTEPQQENGKKMEESLQEFSDKYEAEKGLKLIAHLKESKNLQTSQESLGISVLDKLKASSNSKSLKKSFPSLENKSEDMGASCILSLSSSLKQQQPMKKSLKEELKEKFNILEKNLKQAELIHSLDKMSGEASPVRKDSKKSQPNQIRLELSRLTTIEAAGSVSSPFKVSASPKAQNIPDKQTKETLFKKAFAEITSAQSLSSSSSSSSSSNSGDGGDSRPSSTESDSVISSPTKVVNKNNKTFFEVQSLPKKKIPESKEKNQQSIPIMYSPALTSNKGTPIAQEVQFLSNNFELKLRQHQLRTSHICLRISEIIQNLSKAFFIQDIQNNWKRKQIMLDDNKLKIEFLLKKQKIPKEYANKITNILGIFSSRVNLLEKMGNLEKSVRTQLEQAITHEEIHESLFQIQQAGEVSSDRLKITKPFLYPQHLRRGTMNPILSNDANFKLSPSIFKRQNKPSKYHKTDSQEGETIKSSNSVSNNGKEELSSQTSSQSSDAQDEDSSSDEENSNKTNENNNNNKFNTQQQSTQQQDNKQRQNKSKNQLEFQTQAVKESTQKFDEIMKKALQSFEEEQLQLSRKTSKYHDGYFSDGTIQDCYKGLEKLNNDHKENAGDIKDFEFIKLISKGAFGRVWLVKKKKTDNIYAMKIVNLAEKVNKNTLASLQNEKDILKIVSGDFVVKAIQSFSHESYLCFVLEYMVGGDLGGIIQQYGVLDQSVARFYIAEIILACSQLHQAGIVHRDLKPDNLLLDSKGHLKLTDFGLSDMGMKSRNNENGKLISKKVRQDCDNLRRGMEKLRGIKGAEKIFSVTPSTKSDKTRELIQMKTNLDVILRRKKGEVSENPSSITSPSSETTTSKSIKQQPQMKHRIIGTPDYIPPEVVQGTSNLNSPTIDWWSVGIILFEMLVGIPPFNDETVELVFDNISNMRVPWDQISIGYGEDCISPEAADLIKRLMDFNPNTRLGVNGVSEIQQHSFFDGFDWANVRKMIAPVVPKVKNLFDTSNFDKQKVYSEKETIDPFFGLAKPTEEVSQAKDILKGYNFQMKRYDILYEENCHQLEEIEKKMKFMEEEIIKDEEELEKLEVEYGTDSDDDQEEDSTFKLPRSVVTFQDLETLTSPNSNPSLHAHRLSVMLTNSSLPQFKQSQIFSNDLSTSERKLLKIPQIEKDLSFMSIKEEQFDPAEETLQQNHV